MTELTAVSLFAGIGAFDLVARRAGIRVTAAVEIDGAAAGVLADQFPETTLFPDVTKVTANELRATGFVPARGIVHAGFPCQDLSVAGRRRGMGEGTRSGLYWEIVRLVADLRPRWIILENVPGLLSAVCICPGDERCQDTDRHKGACGAWVKPKGGGPKQWVDHEPHKVSGGSCVGGCIAVHGGAMGAVVGSLGELGYGVAHRVLDAQYFGVPQRRRRVFIVGCLGDWTGPVRVLLEPEGRAGDYPAFSEARQAAADRAGESTRSPGVSVGDLSPCITASYGEQTQQDFDAAAAAALPVVEVVSTLQAGGVARLATRRRISSRRTPRRGTNQ